MAKPKRGVQFNHKGSNHNGRRPSVSESDGASDAGSPGSPMRAATNGMLETSKEEVGVSVWNIKRFFGEDMG